MPLNFQQAAPQLADAFQGGGDTVCEYYDDVKKVFILVAAGESAAVYKNLVESGKALERVASDRTAKMISDALKKEGQQGKPER